MLKKKNCALLGLGILLGGTYEILKEKKRNEEIRNLKRRINRLARCHNEFVIYQGCLLYTSDAADDTASV